MSDFSDNDLDPLDGLLGSSSNASTAAPDLASMHEQSTESIIQQLQRMRDTGTTAASSATATLESPAPTRITIPDGPRSGTLKTQRLLTEDAIGDGDDDRDPDSPPEAIEQALAPDELDDRDLDDVHANAHEPEQTKPSNVQQHATVHEERGSIDPAPAFDQYMDTLEPAEQARVAMHALRRGPGPTEPDWVIALAMQRAASDIQTYVASIARLIEDQPREFTVKIEDPERGPVATHGDLEALTKTVEELSKIVGALPYKPPHVAALLDPVSQLVAATGVLVKSINETSLKLEETRQRATAAIESSGAKATEILTRTAWNQQAMPAATASKYARLTIGALTVIFAIELWHDFIMPIVLHAH